MNENPEQTRASLSAIKEVSAETLGELRSVLDILRAGGTEAPRSPTSGLAHLDDLLERTRVAGLDVTKWVQGDERPVPPEVDLAAFRIIQEALTNVRRHSGSSSARVTLTYEKDALGVRIEDDGDGRNLSSDKPGTGIEGMRERALALGGTFVASSVPGRGFLVKALLPAVGGREG
jgi:signal transduction histidine kinase